MISRCGSVCTPERSRSALSLATELLMKATGVVCCEEYYVPNIRLVVASKDPIFRTALGALLKGIEGFEVVAETEPSGLAEAATKLVRGVILVELPESGADGLRTLATLMQAAPSAAVVVLSSNQNLGYIRTMLATGIKAYLLRSASNSELYKAIRVASRQRRYLDPRLGDSLAELRLGRNAASGRQRLNSLSARESEVLRDVARGFTTRAIASRLSVSERTVQTYRERIYEKLQLRARADLVNYAIAHGMLDSVDIASQLIIERSAGSSEKHC
jgi:two-component system, NarL family, response regulator NreC